MVIAGKACELDTLSLVSICPRCRYFILSSLVVTVAGLSHDEAVVPSFPARAVVAEKSAVVHLPPLVCGGHTGPPPAAPSALAPLSLCPSCNSAPETRPRHTPWKDSLKYMLLSVKKVTPPTSLVENEIQGNGWQCPGTWRNWG